MPPESDIATLSDPPRAAGARGLTAVVRAYAKINLHLRVLHLRTDRFHEVRTIFQSIELHDTVTIRLRPGPFALHCTAPGVPADAANLAWRAAARLWPVVHNTGELRDLEIAIEKRIPPAAGLGGGSADAAAVLAGLPALFGANLAPDRLAGIGRELGADVPFFLQGGTAVGHGRGDTVHPLPDYRACWIVLVFPGIPVVTADAYRWYDVDVSAPPADEDGAIWPSADGVNDLEPPVTARHPEITAARRALEEAGCQLARMSGSGSTVFGVFADRRAAEAAHLRLAAHGWQALLTRSVDRDEYARRVRVSPPD